MTPVLQEIIDKDRGDCVRAVYASLLDLELCQVPHFILFGDKWFPMLYAFLDVLDYEFAGTEFFTSQALQNKKPRLYKKYSINGYFAAGVKSATFDGCTHLVVMDQKGTVVHDPNPNQAWLGKNIIKTKEIKHFHLVKKVKRRR